LQGRVAIKRYAKSGFIGHMQSSHEHALALYVPKRPRRSAQSRLWDAMLCAG
jgi:hypothetical protein